MKSPRLNVFRGLMEPTRTFQRRWWLWIPTPGMPCDGFLLLGQLKEKSHDIDEQTYGVQEVPSKYGFGWRSFAVRKCGAQEGGDDEQYTTSIGGRAQSQCTCKAGRTHNEICRHRCGLTAAILAGAIPAKQLQGA